MRRMRKLIWRLKGDLINNLLITKRSTKIHMIYNTLYRPCYLYSRSHIMNFASAGLNFVITRHEDPDSLKISYQPLSFRESSRSDTSFLNFSILCHQKYHTILFAIECIRE